MARKSLTGYDNNNQRFINVADPTSSTDGANKQYVDNLLAGWQWKQPVRAATTANITTLAGGAPNTLDGVTLALNDRILVKDQSTGAQNGLYTVTTLGTGSNGTWTRATDMDAAAEFPNATVLVSEGTVNADKVFTVTTNAPITVGTTAIVWAQVGAGATYTADGNGIEVSANTFSLELDTNSGLSKSATGLKVDTTIAGNGMTMTSGVINVVPAASGGISVAADSISVDTAIVVRKYAANIGNGSLTSITVTHNLGTRDITWSLQDATSFAFVDCDAVATDTNNLTLTFVTAPTTNQYRVVVHG